MASLEERLKQIRQSSLAKARSPASQLKVKEEVPKASSSRDEVDDLLRQTRQLVDVEREQKRQSSPHNSEDIEAWLAQDSEGEEEEEGASAVIGQDTSKEIECESRRLTREAEQALSDLHSEGAQDEAERLLRVEPKLAPVLSRTPSHGSRKTSSLSLEDDLADAMSGELGKESRDDAKIIDDTSSREVDELIARLTLLRSNTRGTKEDPQPDNVEKEDDDDKSTFSFDLPSAPSTKPVIANADGDGDIDWKEKHGVKDRNLSAYEALVRLNSKDLGEPSNMKKKVKMQTEEKDETDDWCCICNEDAIQSCVGCDGDLYCHKCWNEGHQDMEADERAEHRRKLLRGQKGKPVMAL
ncbi:hypothetical protein CBS101457_004606 [Exobasidium rhododendri]|nr:hypothetical protein CBS101457_004606 [Exobasidium rhododendri]